MHTRCCAVINFENLKQAFSTFKTFNNKMKYKKDIYFFQRKLQFISDDKYYIVASRSIDLEEKN